MRRRVRWRSTLLLVFLYLSSALAVYCNLIGQFDPVATATRFLDSGERDRALTAAEFGLENHLGDQDKLRQIQGRSAYTTAEKIRDVFWTGAVMGRVENTYSGLGTLAADLLIIGDVRDLTIQTLNKIKGEEVDRIVTALAAIGVGTSLAGVTGVGAVADAALSLIKNGAKYLKKFGGLAKHSLLRASAAGKRLSQADLGRVWMIFKDSGYDLPSAARVLSKVQRAKDLKSAGEIMSVLKGGGVLFLERTGAKGLSAYNRIQRFKAGKFFLNSFKRNPSGVIGVSRFHAVLAGIKFTEKEGVFNIILILISSAGFALALLPNWAVWAVFGLSSLLLIGRVRSWARSTRIPDPEEVEGPMIEFPGPS